MREDPSELERAGWEALSQRRWARARSLFERAVAGSPSAAAFEGLAWATWWLDDAEATLAARERAYRCYRDGGDEAGAARAAMWLAGEPDAARRLAASTAELGRALGVIDLEMLGLALEGTALVALARIPEGMRCLDEAAGTALADEGQLPISGAWTCCLMIDACESVGDLERARQWCDRVSEFARRNESAYLFGICRTHYAAVHLLRGEWERAEAELVAAVEAFERSRPAYACRRDRVELRRRQGRPRDALALVERAPSHPRSLLCRAAVALDSGDALEAVELVERSLRQTAADARFDRAAALALLVRARARQGELETARGALAELEETARLVGTAPLRAATALAAATVEAAARSHERARVLFEDAIDLFAGCGLPFEGAQARLQLAGDAEDARPRRRRRPRGGRRA